MPRMRAGMQQRWALALRRVGRIRKPGLRPLVRGIWRWIVVLLAVPIAVLSVVAGRTNKHIHIFGNRVAVATLLVILVGCFVLVETVAVAHIERRFANLRRGAERASAAQLALLKGMRDELIRLEKKARYYSEGRISLFRLDGDKFVLAARRSRMPRFDTSLGRADYPSDRGILGMALRDEHAEEHGLPDPGPEPAPPRPEWIQWQVEHGVDRAAARALTMRSQCYVAFRLDLVDRSPGAIVFESTVSDAEVLAAGGTAAKRSVTELRRIVGESRERLAQLLDHSCAMPAEVLRQRLGEFIEERRRDS